MSLKPPLRILFSALFLAFFACALRAEEPTQILFQPKKLYPAQGGPAVKLAYFPAGRGLLVGGWGDVVIGESYGIGAGGYSLATELLADVGGKKRDIGLSYGGLRLERNFLPYQLLYFNVATMIGPGQSWSVTRMEGAQREYATFFIIEPELNIMLNVTRELRLGLGLGYRATGGADLGFALGSPLNGFAGTFTLLYGKL